MVGMVLGEEATVAEAEGPTFCGFGYSRSSRISFVDSQPCVGNQHASNWCWHGRRHRPLEKGDPLC